MEQQARTIPGLLFFAHCLPCNKPCIVHCNKPSPYPYDMNLIPLRLQPGSMYVVFLS